MKTLLDFTLYEDAQREFSTKRLWDLFGGEPERFNIASECIDRYAGNPGRVAVRVVRAKAGYEVLTFLDISEQSSKFAHWLADQGISKGDRVAFMLEPSRAFYVSLFGALKCGAIGVPLFTLFGPDGLKLRLEDCAPSLLIANSEKFDIAQEAFPNGRVILDKDMFEIIKDCPSQYVPATSAADLAIFQYTSGTTRELPAAVKHTHRALVVLMSAALYGTGIRPGDEFFCPSSPAWGHGLWHGTLAPLALGVTTGSFAGKFDAKELLAALSAFGVTNLSAAATHYRMIKNSNIAEEYSYKIKKLSYTGEPIDGDTLQYIQSLFGCPVCSMYGTTEIGVILVNYPGAADFKVKDGSLGKPVPGIRVEIHNPDGSISAPNSKGQIMLLRKGEWIPTKDLGWADEEGYFYHAGRADDVIISAGWTMSAVEIEQTLLSHPDVQEAAVIGVPDQLRGHIVKAFLVAKGRHDEKQIEELQIFAKNRLSQHEFPRKIEFVDTLIKTPAGKINRKALRDREAKKMSEGLTS